MKTGFAEEKKPQPTPTIKAQPKEEKQWTVSFNLDKCSFSTTGKNQYFILEPGYQLTLEGKEGELLITVLDETKKIGNIETRIVEERETEDGELTEVSRNFFAIGSPSNSVFYFGEEVDIYKNGKIVGHGGGWQADKENFKPGLMMPGIILLGARYYQEIAPGTALDRAEIISNTETFQTPAGKFENCLKTEETSPLEPHSREYKYYAPGIGLIRDGDLLLTKSGFLEKAK